MMNTLLEKTSQKQKSHVFDRSPVTATSRRTNQYALKKVNRHLDIATIKPALPQQRVKITASALNIRKGPGTNYKILGQFRRDTLVDYHNEINNWLVITYLGETAYICKQYTKPVFLQEQPRCDTTSKSLQAVSLARKYLNYTTKDLLGKLTYLTDLSKNSGTNNGYNLNCANFVSAILNEVGLIHKHVVGCSKLRQVCTSEGYQIIPKSEARPGDVWINSHHTELVDSVFNGIITLIGSNNNGDKIQEITLDSKSAQKDGDIYGIRS